MRLQKAELQDCGLICTMQKEAFAQLLEKYQDYDVSPASDTAERIRARFLQPQTTYYLICDDEDRVAGAVRVVRMQDGWKRISPLFILKPFRNRGLAQCAISGLEQIYGADHWKLETILQQKGNCYLYEKLGYVRTGRIDHVNERMDLVFYEKQK